MTIIDQFFGIGPRHFGIWSIPLPSAVGRIAPFIWFLAFLSGGIPVHAETSFMLSGAAMEYPSFYGVPPKQIPVEMPEYLAELDSDPLHGGQAESEQKPPPTPYGWKQIVYDLKYVATRPFRLDKRDGLWLGGAAAATGVLYGYRDRIRDDVQNSRNESRSDFLDVVRTMGKTGFTAGVILSAYGASYITKNHREKETAVLLMESATLSQMGTLIGKVVVATERPPDRKVRFFYWRGNTVSGDTALAAAIVPPLRRQYLRVNPGDSLGRRLWKWAGTGALYAGALLTGYQRIDSDAHWAPDAFLGLMTGLAVGEVLCEAHDRTEQEREQAKKNAGISLGAMPGGLAVHIRF